MMFSEHQHYRHHGVNYPSGVLAPHLLSRPSLGAGPMQASDIPTIHSASTEGYLGTCCDVKPQLNYKLSRSSMGTLPATSNLMNGNTSINTNRAIILDDKR